MPPLFQRLFQRSGAGGSPDKLLNELTARFRKPPISYQEWQGRVSPYYSVGDVAHKQLAIAYPYDDDYYPFMEQVGENLGIINHEFFDYLNERVESSGADSKLSQMRDMLYRAQFSIVIGELISHPPFSLEPLEKLIEDHQLAENEIEPYLKQASQRYHFSLYVCIIAFCKSQFRHKGLAFPEQQYQFQNMKTIINVASRLAPQAAGVAENLLRCQWLYV